MKRVLIALVMLFTVAMATVSCTDGAEEVFVAVDDQKAPSNGGNDEGDPDGGD